MNRRCITAIWRKDMRDALRDSRVLTALLMPLLFGLLYSFIFSDDTAVTKVKVGVVSDGPTLLTRTVADQAPQSMRITFVTVHNTAELRSRVQDKKFDVGLVVPSGFDQGVRSGASPTLLVLAPKSGGGGGDYAAAALDRAVQALAGRAPAARIVSVTVPPAHDSGSVVLDTLGARTTFIMVVIVMLLVMVAVYAVPAVLVEETEKKTFDALTLIASTADVITAKALFGIALSVVSVPILLAITRGRAHDIAALAIAIALSAVVLCGIGLFFAGLLKTQQQVNTWSGLLLLVLLAPAFTIGLPVPASVNTALAFLPTVYSYHLIANAYAGRALFASVWLSYLVLVAWGLAAYGLLWWRLSRQEA